MNIGIGTIIFLLFGEFVVTRLVIYFEITGEWSKRKYKKILSLYSPSRISKLLGLYLLKPSIKIGFWGVVLLLLSNFAFVFCILTILLYFINKLSIAYIDMMYIIFLGRCFTFVWLLTCFVFGIFIRIKEIFWKHDKEGEHEKFSRRSN